MKELFPLNTFQQDAVLKRLNDLLDNDKELDDKMPYDEDTDTFSIDGDLDVDGDLAVDGKISGNEIVENMSGYSCNVKPIEHFTQTPVYAGVVKNGNKLTFCYAANIQQDGDLSASTIKIVTFTVPSEVASKLYPIQIGQYGALDLKIITGVKSDNTVENLEILIEKETSGIGLDIRWNSISKIPTASNMYIRIECTFLLSDNLIPQP